MKSAQRAKPESIKNIVQKQSIAPANKIQDFVRNSGRQEGLDKKDSRKAVKLTIPYEAKKNIVNSCA